MKHCVNINDPDIKKLIQQMGLNPAITVAKISVWQTKHNNFLDLPSAAELGKPVSLVEQEVIEEQTKLYESIFNRDMTEALDPHLEKYIDENLNKIFQRLALLETLRGGDQDKEVTSRMNALMARAVELAEERTHEKLAEVALFQLAEVKRILDTKTNPNPSAFDISQAKIVIEYTKDFDRFLLKAPASLKDKKNLIRTLNVSLGSRVEEEIMKQALGLAKLVQDKITQEDLEPGKAYEDTGAGAGLTLDLSTSKIPLGRLIGKVITRMNRLGTEHFEEGFKGELNKLLISMGKKKFESGDFAEIMEDNMLILEFGKSFFDEQSNLWKDHYAIVKELADANKEPKPDSKKIKAIKAKLKDSHDNMFTWYRDSCNYYLSPENIQKYTTDLENFKKSQLSSDGELGPKGQAAVNKWMATNSPYLVGKRNPLTNKVDITRDAVPAPIVNGERVRNENWHRYLTATPRDSYKNPKYEKASQSPLYQFMVNKYVEALKMLPREVAVDVNNYHRFLDEFTFGLTESDNRMKFSINGLKDIAKNTFYIKINQAMLDGGEVKNIYDSDGNVTRQFKPILQLKDEKGRAIPQISHQTIKQIKDNQHFRDPLELLGEFYKLAVVYKHKIHTQPALDLLLYKLENTPGISKNLIDRVLKDIHENPSIIENGLVNEYQRASFAVNAALSGVTRTDSSVGVVLSENKKAELEKKQQEWADNNYKGPAPTIDALSAVKTSDALVDYTRMTLIGLKPFTAVTNLILGLVNNYIYGARNKEFREEHLDVAFRILMGNAFKFYTKTLFGDRLTTEQAEKNANLSEKFGITSTLYETKDPDVAIRAKHKIVKFMYSLQEGGEFLIANQALIAMMLNTKITSKTGEETNLYEAYDKEGNLKPEFNTPEWSSIEVLDSQGNNISKLNTFRNSLDAIRKRTQGDYQSAMQLKGKWYGRILMMFRTWIPQSIRERFGTENEDFKGRYRTYWDVFSKAGKSNGIKSLLETTGRITLASVARMTNILPIGKYRFTKFSDAGNLQLEKYLEKLGASDLDLENMRANVKELQFILLTIAMTWGIKALAGDDDDDDNYTRNFLLNINQRVYQDLTAFMNPASALSIIKDPFPILKTIKDGIDVATASVNYMEHPESRYYTKGFNKGDLKLWKETKDLLPIWSAIQSTQGTMRQVFGQDSYRYSSK